MRTEDAAEAIARLKEMGIEPFLISSTLVAVVAQRLVRVLCKNCKEPYRPSKQSFAFFKTIENPSSGDYHFFQSKGCSGCNQSGFKGMTAIHEVLLVNDAVRDEILNGSAASDIKRIARHHAGMVTMSEDGFYKALKGTTALEEIIRVLYKTDPQNLEPISIDELIRRSCKEPGQNSLSN